MIEGKIRDCVPTELIYGESTGILLKAGISLRSLRSE